MTVKMRRKIGKFLAFYFSFNFVVKRVVGGGLRFWGIKCSAAWIARICQVRGAALNMKGLIMMICLMFVCLFVAEQ